MTINTEVSNSGNDLSVVEKEDLPPRRSNDLQTSDEEVPDYQEDEEDGLDTLNELEELYKLDQQTSQKRAKLPTVSWPDSDEISPPYAHLHDVITEENRKDIGSEFNLSADVLELLITANRFKPEGPNGLIVFALRGARLKQGDAVENVSQVTLDEVRPDHKTFQCTIGFFNRTTKKITAYMASTVPNEFFMLNYYKLYRGMAGTKNIKANMLPTGCYVYRVAGHSYNKSGKPKIFPALRLSDPDTPTKDGTATVLRTHNNLSFTIDDFWDKTIPYDNIHCAYSMDKFSSAGCLTIRGANRQGPWGQFQDTLDALIRKKMKRIDLVLLTGQEANIADWLIRRNIHKDPDIVDLHLGRLRQGSQGVEVTKLQKKLGFNGTGYFGPVTKKSFCSFQKNNNLRVDGIYSPEMERKIGWNILSETFISSTDTINTETSGLDVSSIIFISVPTNGILSQEGKLLTVSGEGVWRINSDTGNITFIPETGFIGKPQPVTYQVADFEGATANGTITVEVIKKQSAPQAHKDRGVTQEGVPITLDILANDTDLDGDIDPTSVTIASPPDKGVLAEEGRKLTVVDEGVWIVNRETGHVTFTPQENFYGITTTITYQVKDHFGATDVAPIDIEVTPVNDPPIIGDDFATTTLNTPITINVLKNDSDVDSKPPEAVEKETQDPISEPEKQSAIEGSANPVNLKTLKRIAPNGRPDILYGIAKNSHVLEKYGILKSPLRWCHFMAQCCQESDGFRTLVEYGGKSYFKKYDYNTRIGKGLGNIKPGDGYKFRGRGMIQLTGRENYRKIGDQLGIDLENNPDQASDPQISLLVAAEYWKKRNINQQADRNNLTKVTKLINGGTTHIERRRSYLLKAWEIWGDGSNLNPRVRRNQTGRRPAANNNQPEEININRFSNWSCWISTVAIVQIVLLTSVIFFKILSEKIGWLATNFLEGPIGLLLLGILLLTSLIILFRARDIEDELNDPFGQDVDPMG